MICTKLKFFFSERKGFSCLLQPRMCCRAPGLGARRGAQRVHHGGRVGPLSVSVQSRPIWQETTGSCSRRARAKQDDGNSASFFLVVCSWQLAAGCFCCCCCCCCCCIMSPSHGSLVYLRCGSDGTTAVAYEGLLLLTAMVVVFVRVCVSVAFPVYRR